MSRTMKVSAHITAQGKLWTSHRGFEELPRRSCRKDDFRQAEQNHGTNEGAKLRAGRNSVVM